MSVLRSLAIPASLLTEVGWTIRVGGDEKLGNEVKLNLATWAASDANKYRENGRRLAEVGCVESTAQ